MKLGIILLISVVFLINLESVAPKAPRTKPPAKGLQLTSAVSKVPILENLQKMLKSLLPMVDFENRHIDGLNLAQVKNMAVETLFNCLSNDQRKIMNHMIRECEQAETRAEQNDADDQPDFFEDETPPEGFVLAMKEVKILQCFILNNESSIYTLPARILQNNRSEITNRNSVNYDNSHQNEAVEMINQSELKEDEKDQARYSYGWCMKHRMKYVMTESETTIFKTFVTIMMERVLNNKPVLDIKDFISKRMTEYLPELKEMVCLIESLLKNGCVAKNNNNPIETAKKRRGGIAI